MPCSSKLARSHLATNIFRELRKFFHDTFSLGHSQWYSLLFLVLWFLLCDSCKSTLATFVPTAATGCGVAEECSSEQLFEDCHSRGATESLLCYCSNGVPHACRYACDSSEAPDACPPQCQGYVACKVYSNMTAEEGRSVGWSWLVGIFSSLVVLAVVTGLVIVLCKRRSAGTPVLSCCVRTRQAPGSSRNHPAAVGASTQEELSHGLQETLQPGIQLLSPIVPSGLPPEHESAALLVNS